MMQDYLDGVQNQALQLRRLQRFPTEFAKLRPPRSDWEQDAITAHRLHEIQVSDLG